MTLTIDRLREKLAEAAEALAAGAARDGRPVHAQLLAEAARKAEVTLETERRSAETAGADEGWQPIETAPKDGTHILAYCDRMKEVGEVKWSTSFGRWGATWVMAGFNQPWASRPTHWRPLPAPPQPAVQGNQK